MLSKKILSDLKVYVERHFQLLLSDMTVEETEEICYSHTDSIKTCELDEFVDSRRKPTFQQMLFHFMDQKGTSDAAIYKKAWLDRRHFSKIRSNPDYRIGKSSVIALALALELPQNDAEELLHAAGFTLSDSNESDLVIRFCIINNIYNLHDVNEALDYLGLAPLRN